MYSFEIHHSDIEDKLVAPLYRVKNLIKRVSEQFDTKSINDLIDYCISGSYIREYAKKGELYLRVQNIRGFEVNLNEDDIVFIDAKKFKIPDRIRVKEGDVVIVRTTSSPSNFGTAALISPHIKGAIISQHVTRVGFKNINPYYAVCFLNSKYGKMQLIAAGYGTTRFELTHAMLERIKIPLIPSKEQKKVAKLVKQAESKHIEALNKIEQAKKIFINTLGIDTEGIKEERTYKVSSSDLGDVFTPKFYYPKYLNTLKSMKEKFDTISLGEIARIDRGIEVGSKNYKTPFNREDNDVPFIRTSDIINYEIDNYPDYYISGDIYSKLNQDIKPNDILFTNDGKIGLSAILVEGDKCIIQSHIRRVRVEGKLSPYYIFAFLTTNFALYQVYQRILVQATIPTIGNGLSEIEIPILPKDKQKEISNLVKKAFELKKEKKELIKKAKQEVEELMEKGTFKI